MNRFGIVLGVAVAVWLAPVPECYAETGEPDTFKPSFYVGAGIGAAQLSDGSSYINQSSMAYRLIAGYALKDVFRLEVSAVTLDDLYTYYPSPNAVGNAAADGQGITTGAIVAVPVTDRFRINGKAGLIHWSTDATALAQKGSGTDPSIGIGFEYRFPDALSLGLDFDFNRFDKTDVYIGTLSLRYRF